MSWWKTAKPGDFVVALEDINPNLAGVDPIYEGRVYEIKDVFVATDEYNIPGAVALRFAGHNNGRPSGRNGGWDVRYFRPVKPLSTSLTDCLSAPVSPWGSPTKERV